MNNIIRKNIKNKRKLAGLTQDDMAKALGVTRSAYIAIEGGRVKRIPEEHILTSAQFLNVSIDELYGNDVKDITGDRHLCHKYINKISEKQIVMTKKILLAIIGSSK